jgi:hypothetical protein
MSETKPDPKLETPAETPPEAPKAEQLSDAELDATAGGGWPNVYVYTGGAGSGPI